MKTKLIDHKKIVNAVRLSPLTSLGLYHRYRYWRRKNMMDSAISRFGTSGIPIPELKRKMKEAMIKYHWDFDEFFMYDYMKLTPEERASFVPEFEKNIFCDKVNDYSASRIFMSKWESYKLFKAFYKRDCVSVQAPLLDVPDALSAFLEKHPKFILKPDSASSGRGIDLFDTRDVKDAVEKIQVRINQYHGRYVLEELIAQSPEMGKFHPSSVNSLRMRSFRFDDRTIILPSNLRLGQGDSFVDNTGKGGISAALDEDGTVIAACDEAGTSFDVHPDTGEQIHGIKVPRWEEAVDLVKQLAEVLPSVRYVGWDLALTDEGWVMIEGNDKGMFVGIQKTRQKGFRPELNKILAELNICL